jgi:hypothetical protein
MNSKRDEGLERTLRDAAPDRFAAGFADRVATRLGAGRGPAANRSTADFTVTLERQFLRIVPILAAASLLLGLYSWWGGRRTADSLLDATLRLPQVSIATAYQSEYLYDDTGGDN